MGRKKTRLSAEEISIKYFGGEPHWEKPTPEKSETKQLSALLNWYSYKYAHEDAKKFILAYLGIKKEESLALNLEKLADSNFKTTAGWVARILSLGAEGMSKKPQKYLDKEIARLKQLIKPTDVVKEVQKVDIQQILDTQLKNYFADIEQKIDEFILSNFKSSFSLRSWLSETGVKAVQAKKIAENYEKQVNEFKEAKKGSDPQLVEGYSCWNKKQLNLVIEFFGKLVADSWEWYECAKEIGKLNRKPRLRKSKPPEVQVAKLKFQREDQTYGLCSVEPKQIVGATQLWIYNTKNRKLGVYNASNDRGFFVKGNKIQNFDEGSSIEKKLRKPQVILEKIKEGGKVALRKTLEFIKSKEKNLNGRFTENTIILRVL